MVPFKDLLTATFSLIIDVTILEHQHFDDEDKCIEVGSSLIEAGWILLSERKLVWYNFNAIRFFLVNDFEDVSNSIRPYITFFDVSY